LFNLKFPALLSINVSTISSSIKCCAILADKSPNFSKIFLLEYDDDSGDDDLDDDDLDDDNFGDDDSGDDDFGDDDFGDDNFGDDDFGDDDLGGIIIYKKILYIWKI